MHFLSTRDLKGLCHGFLASPRTAKIYICVNGKATNNGLFLLSISMYAIYTPYSMVLHVTPDNTSASNE